MNKRKIKPDIITIILIGLFMISAIKCKGPTITKRTRIIYAPVYLTYKELRASISTKESIPLKETGKIYIKGNYTYVNELQKGIHIIYNENPSQPENIAFIEIPGNVDIAIKDNILYADSYIDMVALDITNPRNTAEVKRIEDIFPYPDAYNNYENYDYSGRYIPVDKSKGIATGWAAIGAEEYEEAQYENETVYLTAVAESSTGAGGSLARFTISGEYLYALNNSEMHLFRISNPSDPTIWSQVSIGWDIETIFAYNDKLFIGSMNGMYIYDNIDPANPVKLSEFTHATSCDPVVVQGDYAYITLRGGTTCGGFNNQMDIIDISSILSPTLMKSYSMQGPYGLGIDRDMLFICDGNAGLKVFNAADPMNIELIAHFSEITTRDIILNGNIALVIGPDGLYYYDYSNPDNIQLLSKIVIDEP